MDEIGDRDRVVSKSEHRAGAHHRHQHKRGAAVAPDDRPLMPGRRDS
jgi:hypothetical protein